MPGRRGAWRFFAAVIVALCAGACDMYGERDRPPALVLSPATALQGSALTVLLTAPGVPMSSCRDLSGASLRFSLANAPSPIEATAIELLDSETLRARLLVGTAATPGDHLVALQCDERTALEGTFSVRERLEDAIVTVDPAAVKAGSFNFQIDIFGQDIAFDEETSHVVFGDGEHVTVREQYVIDALSQMRVFVDVDPLAPEGPMELAVVTGDLVARGEIEILPRDTPWILVEPDHIVLTGTEVPAQTTLTITGTSIAFVEPDPAADAGAGEEATVVAFPENPGLHVTMMSVSDLDPAIMSVDILADQGAPLGATPLTVTTGGETVSAAFTVLPPSDGAAFLSLAPAYLARGANAQPVAARAYGAAPFAPGEPAPGAVFAEEAGCHVEAVDRVSADELLVELSVDGDFVGDACTLRAQTSTQILVAKIAVVAPSVPTLSGFTSIAQGASGVWIAVSTVDVDGVVPLVFDDDTLAAVGGRSGIGIVTQLPAEDGRSLLVIIDQVAADAPVGQAALHVLDDGQDYAVAYSVLPAEATPSNVLASPGVLSAARRRTTIALEAVDPSGDGSSAEAMSFDAGAPPEVEFDDPAIRATAVAVLDARHVTVDAALSPSLDADTAVMYVTSAGKKAAASFRVLGAAREIVTCAEPDLSRGSKDEVVFVEASIRHGVFESGAVVGELLEGIGVRVLSVDLYPDTTPANTDDLYLQLEVASDGPSGWFGVVLSDGREVAVLPLRVGGGADTLTMTLSPQTADGALHPGELGAIVDAVLPAVAPAADPLAEARGGAVGAHASLEALSGSVGTLIVDVAEDVVAAADGIPIAILFGDGAAVGFAPYLPAPAATLEEGLPLDVYLDPEVNPVARIDATPALPFSWATISASEPSHADAALSLLADDGVSVQGASQRGLVWLTGGAETQRLVARPTGDPASLPSSVRLASYGAALGAEIEDEIPTPIDDPCAAPALLDGEIGAPLDDDWFEVVSASTCDLTAVVLARALGVGPWATPDTMLELRDDVGGVPLLEKSLGWPTAAHADPRLFFTIDPAHPRLLRVAPELGSAGAYLVNVRRDGLIREICGGDGSAPAFIEFDLRPGTDLAAFSLRLVDPVSLLSDAELPLSGYVAADGIVVVADVGEGDPDVVDTVGVTDLPAGSAWAIQLIGAGGVVDAVQVGGAAGAGEGVPISNADAPRCIARPAVIDTADNARDFYGNWIPTPGV